MPSKTVTWIGNADENDGTAIITIGVDGSGNSVVLKAGKSATLTEAQIKQIHPRHILVEGNSEESIKIRDQERQTDFRAIMRGKPATSNLGR